MSSDVTHSAPSSVEPAEHPDASGAPEQASPVARGFVGRHPLLMTFVVVAIGMVAMLLYASRDVELLPGQLATLVVATIALAGACVWIINWE